MVRMISLIIVLLTGCYYEVADDRGASGSKKTPSQAGSDDSTSKPSDSDKITEESRCRLTEATGCFEGQIPSAPGIYVNGKEFFDVDDLANKFHTLINIEKITGLKLAADGYSVSFETPLDNRNFANGFQIFLKGENADSTKALRSGKFSLHKLPVGDYELRVQKVIRYKVNVQKQLTEEEQKTFISQEDKIQCVTLFSSESVEILPNVRSKKVFEFYELMPSEFNCHE